MSTGGLKNWGASGLKGGLKNWGREVLGEYQKRRLEKGFLIRIVLHKTATACYKQCESLAVGPEAILVSYVLPSCVTERNYVALEPCMPVSHATSCHLPYFLD